MKTRHPMKETKRLTLVAMMSALTVVFLVIASVLSTLDLTMAALSSFCMVFLYIEVGSPYTYLSWLASTLLTFIFFPNGYIFLVYFFIFGIYPILKGFIERLPRWAWLPVKLVWFNAILVLLLFLIGFILGIDVMAGEGLIGRILIYVLANVSFLAYDLLMTVIARLYILKYRDKFHKYLK